MAGRQLDVNLILGIAAFLSISPVLCPHDPRTAHTQEVFAQ